MSGVAMGRKAVSIAMVIGPNDESWQGALLTKVLYDDGSVLAQRDDGAWLEVKAADTVGRRMNEQSALAKAVRAHAHFWPCAHACDDLMLSGEALDQLRALVDVSDAAELEHANTPEPAVIQQIRHAACFDDGYHIASETGVHCEYIDIVQILRAYDALTAKLAAQAPTVEMVDAVAQASAPEGA